MIEHLEIAARIAGSIIREGFGSRIEIEYKTNISNLVTNIDLKAEEAIINYILNNFPTHSILSEESGKSLKDEEFLWVVDPLDGTTNFAHGLPIFSVSIGLMNRGEIIAGVIYDVMRNVLYTAELNKGAFANGRKLSVNENDDIRKSLLVTGFPYNVDENPDNVIEKFSKVIKSSRAVRRLGSAAIDMCYVAEGVFDGFWEVSLNPWDMCAGVLLIEEAGGRVTDENGLRIDIFEKQIVATNGKIHNSLLNLLSEAGREAMQ